MRVFFCADTTCVFFVNGMYLGAVDAFERSVELDPADGVFCELKAAGYAPVRFCLNEDFLFSPPEGVELYFFGGAVCVHVQGFVRADPCLRVLWQKRLGGALLTLCVQGRVVLNLESARGFFQIGLPFSFEECVPSRAGELFLLESRTAFALIGDDGEVRALSEGRVTERGARVTAEIPLHDSLGHIVRRTWENGAAGDCAVLSAREPAEAAFALAFFESLLTGSDPEPWLSPSLAPKKGLLRQFLGDFRRAVLTEKTDVVGLVYARKPRVFDVRRFRVTVEEGKIANIAAEEP